MAIEPDYDTKGNATKDIAAYIIRRDRAARWKNICGFTPPDIDAFLGHKISAYVPSTRKSLDTYKISTTLERLAELNENYVYNPEMSGHPLYAPIRLSKVKRVSLHPHCAQVIINDTDEEIELDICLQAEEPGEELTVIYADDAGAVIDPSNTFYNPDKDAKHTTIGQLSKECKEVNNDEKK